MESVRKMIFSIDSWLPIGTLARYLTATRSTPVKVLVLGQAESGAPLSLIYLSFYPHANMIRVPCFASRQVDNGKRFFAPPPPSA